MLSVIKSRPLLFHGRPAEYERQVTHGFA